MDPAKLVPLFFLAMSASAVVYAVIGRLKVARTADWPSVIGRVLSNAIESETTHHFDSHGTVFAFRIEYEYFVGGRRYVGTKLSANPQLSTSFKSHAQDRSVDYYVGREVNVYYDPHNPADACLERTFEGEWLLWLIGAGAFVGAIVAGVKVMG